MRRALGAAMAAMLLTPAPGAAVPPESRRADPPLWPTVAEAPQGARVERCPWLVRGGAPRTASLVLPAWIRFLEAEAGSCLFWGSETARATTGVLLTLADTRSLASYKRRYVDPYVDIGGDENISDVVYADDVPVFGNRVGERLSYEAYTGGSPTHVEHQMTEGVQLSWYTPVEEWPGQADELDLAARSLGIGAERTVECGRRLAEARVAVRVAVPLRVSSLGAGRTCSLQYSEYFSPLRAAGLVAQPRRGLAATYRALVAREDVRGLRRTSSAPGFGGGRARRLDYRTLATPSQPARRVRILRQDRVRLVWTSALRRWRSERDDYTRLRRGVTIVRLP